MPATLADEIRLLALSMSTNSSHTRASFSSSSASRLRRVLDSLLQFGQKINGSWNGFIGDVKDKIADMAVAPITITERRLTAVSFTESFFHTEVVLLMRRRQLTQHLMSFLSPIDVILWMGTLGNASLVAIAATSFEQSIPRSNGDTTFTLGSSVFCCFSLLFGNTVGGKSPRSTAARLLLNCWAFFATILTSLYTANLAAHLTSRNEETTFTDFSDRKASPRGSPRWRAATTRVVTATKRVETVPKRVTTTAAPSSDPFPAP